VSDRRELCHVLHVMNSSTVSTFSDCSLMIRKQEILSPEEQKNIEKEAQAKAQIQKQLSKTLPFLVLYLYTNRFAR
jgi:hypothetical protein